MEKKITRESFFKDAQEIYELLTIRGYSDLDIHEIVGLIAAAARISATINE